MQEYNVRPSKQGAQAPKMLVRGPIEAAGGILKQQSKKKKNGSSINRLEADGPRNMKHNTKKHTKQKQCQALIDAVSLDVKKHTGRWAFPDDKKFYHAKKSDMHMHVHIRI